MEVAIIKNAGVTPMIFKLCNLVLAPTADIAINKHHLLSSLKNNLVEFGINPKEFIAAQNRNRRTKAGTKDGRSTLFLILDDWRTKIEIIKTIGNNNDTL